MVRAVHRDFGDPNMSITGNHLLLWVRRADKDHVITHAEGNGDAVRRYTNAGPGLSKANGNSRLLRNRAKI